MHNRITHWRWSRWIGLTTVLGAAVLTLHDGYIDKAKDNLEFMVESMPSLELA